MAKLLLCIKENAPIYTEAFNRCGAEATALYAPELDMGYDALVLCGGQDVDPKYYGAENTACGELDPVRDAAEFALLDAYVKAGKPVLGICRGMQLINVYFGGTLTQHMEKTPIHRQSMEHYCTHPVTADPHSLVGKLYGESFRVNSYHHQCVDKLGQGLTITAWAEDIPEALAHDRLPVLAVQWHPEKLCFDRRRPDADDGQPLLQHFVDMCKFYK